MTISQHFAAAKTKVRVFGSAHLYRGRAVRASAFAHETPAQPKGPPCLEPVGVDVGFVIELTNVVL
jgi:hypothetical protein